MDLNERTVCADAAPIDRVVLINDFSEAGGGAQALVILLAQQLANLGIKVTLVVGDGGVPAGRDNKFIEVVSLCEPPLLERPARIAATKGLYNLAAAKMLSQWISRNDTPRTVYHLHNWSHILSASIFGPLRRVHRRTVMHAHDYFLVCPNGAFNDFRGGEICQLVPMSSACISTNCDKRNFAHKLWRVARQEIRRSLWDFDKYRTDVLMVHEGMSEPFIRSGVAPSQLHSVRNPSVPYTNSRIEAEKNREFVFIGRIDEEKGVRNFLEAARKAGAPARIIGDGNNAQQLTEQFPEAIFDGWRTHGEIARLVGSARMVVVPSRYPEPFGLIITESLASGIPVILPNSALLKTEVTERKIGIACDTRSIEELSAAIRLMMTDNKTIEAMSREAFRLRDRLAINPTNWSKVIVSYYITLLGRQQGEAGEALL
jgi:glycosyltransferase involved in cell wall biosynthesis